MHRLLPSELSIGKMFRVVIVRSGIDNIIKEMQNNKQKMGVEGSYGH